MPSRYTQARRPMRVDTILEEDVLLLEKLETHERLSEPFRLRLGMCSEDPALPMDTLVRQPMLVSLERRGGGHRYFHGLLASIRQGARDEWLTTYEAEIVPWFWFLKLHHDCRIFQRLTAPEIIEKVFRSRGYTDFRFHLNGRYETREYCVQYRESDFDFVSRLLEEEGIHYFFDHSEKSHVMVMADLSCTAEHCPGQPKARLGDPDREVIEEEVITSFEHAHHACPGVCSLEDYDFKNPNTELFSTVQGKHPEEVYDYPGRYLTRAEGERYARLRLEEHEARSHTHQGASLCRAFLPGYRFELEGHYRSDLNGEHLLAAVEHKAGEMSYRTGRSQPFSYENHFETIPGDRPFRPARLTPKAVVRGPQTALVVGPAGEEIYVDEHGRVKVQFHWDREGRFDENSSCWIRVSYPWSGKGWGGIHIPRIGQEVIVDFEEGDPDRPIIAGRVYNAVEVPPYGLPANKTQSGFLSRSSPGGGPANANEIRFEDRTGKELVTIHAEKDKLEEVEHDSTEFVGHDRKLTVKNNQTETIEGNKNLTVFKNHGEKILGSMSLQVLQNQTELVVMNKSGMVLGNRQQQIGGNWALKVGKDRHEKTGKVHALESGKEIHAKAGDKIILEAGSQLSLKVGGSFIDISPSEINIQGTVVNINSGGSPGQGSGCKIKDKKKAKDKAATDKDKQAVQKDKQAIQQDQQKVQSLTQQHQQLTEQSTQLNAQIATAQAQAQSMHAQASALMANPYTAAAGAAMEAQATAVDTQVAAMQAQQAEIAAQAAGVSAQLSDAQQTLQADQAQLQVDQQQLQADAGGAQVAELEQHITNAQAQAQAMQAQGQALMSNPYTAAAGSAMSAQANALSAQVSAMQEQLQALQSQPRGIPSMREVAAPLLEEEPKR